GERLVAHLWVAAGRRRHERAGAVENEMGVEALPVDPGYGQHVHQADRSFERHGVHEDVRLLTRLGLDVLEDLVLVVDDRIALTDPLAHDLRHRAIPFPVGLTTAPPDPRAAAGVPTAADDCQASSA